MQLTNFDAEHFLRHHWQQKPLMIRNAFGAWSNPLDPDELAGLALEPGVESRLVTQSSGQWDLEHGPLEEARFAKIGKAPWSLLVQAVDHHVPAVAALLEPFRFVPNWRVDDIMVSYAADRGGVGAHFDQYDVFLVQGLGQRRWQVGGRCDASTPLLPHDGLRLLANFEPVEEWILGPGDMLYVPPGIAHNGIAVGDDCMTYSIGFRAPSRAELIAGWTEHVLDGLSDEDRYADPGLAMQDNPGEISAAALARVEALIVDAVADRERLAHWFGEYVTTPKDPEIDWRPEADIDDTGIAAKVREGAVLVRNPASRFSFIRSVSGALTLFVDGRSYPCTDIAATVAEDVCAADRVEVDQAALCSGEAVTLLVDLVNEGSLAFEAP